MAVPAEEALLFSTGGRYAPPGFLLQAGNVPGVRGRSPRSADSAITAGPRAGWKGPDQ